MWLETKTTARQVKSGVINADWYWLEFRVAGAVPQRVYLRYVVLDIDLPCCGNPHPTDPSYICVLPPGHESADIPCIGRRLVNGTYARIVQVTDRHPFPEMGPYVEEASTTNA